MRNLTKTPSGIQIGDIIGDLTLIRVDKIKQPNGKRKDGTPTFRYQYQLDARCACGEIRTGIRAQEWLAGYVRGCQTCQHEPFDTRVRSPWRKQAGDQIGVYTLCVALTPFDPRNVGEDLWGVMCTLGNPHIKSVNQMKQMRPCGCKPTSTYIGERYGQLQIVDLYANEQNIQIVTCKCQCGDVKDIRLNNLIRGVTKTCGGDKHRKAKTIQIGDQIGEWTVDDLYTEKEWNRKRPQLVTFAACTCSCGNQNTRIPIHNLRSGVSRSCGCGNAPRMSASSIKKPGDQIGVYTLCVALTPNDPKRKNPNLWGVVCKFGNPHIKTLAEMKQMHACGCKKISKYTGQTYNQLKIMQVYPDGKSRQMAVCECQCGEIKAIRLHNVVSGVTKTCGGPAHRKSKTKG